MPDPYRTAPSAGGRTKLARVLITAAFLAAVAAFESVGFRLSYQALHRVAVENGVTESSAWMFPVLVDGGIVLGSMGVVRALSARRSTRPYWCVVIGFTAVSWAFNVSNAPGTAGGWAVATVAPLAQMVALELGMQELRAVLIPPSAAPATEQHTAAAPAPAPAPLLPAEPAPAALPPAPPAAAVELPAPDSTHQDPEQQPEQQSAQHPEDDQQPEQHDGDDEQQPEQRQQRQRPLLAPDDSRPWAVLYEDCVTEEQRIALTRGALGDRPKLNAPQWAVDIGKSETRGRDLLRAARKPQEDFASA